MATIESLPPELLAEIFSFTIRTTKETLWPAHPRRAITEEALAKDHNRPLLLCGVSRHWKSTAESTPNLWIRNFVVIKTPGTVKLAFDRLQIRIKRAGDVGVSLALHARSFKYPHYDKEAFTAFFLSYAPRIDHLQLDLELDLLACITSPAIVFSSLNALSLGWGSPITQTLIDGYTQFPKLTTLRLHKQRIYETTTVYWPNITTLDLDRFYQEEISYMLKASAPNLVHLRVADITGGSAGPLEEPLSFPNLETLDLGTSKSDLTHLLSSIIAPNLRRFRCSAASYRLSVRVLTTGLFKDFIAQARCVLEVVILVEVHSLVDEDSRALGAHRRGIQDIVPEAHISYFGIEDRDEVDRFPSLWEDWDSQCSKCSKHIPAYLLPSHPCQTA